MNDFIENSLPARYQDDCVCIYFGNRNDFIYQSSYHSYKKPLLSGGPFKQLIDFLYIDDLVFLHQTHSARGYAVQKGESAVSLSFVNNGDYLITKEFSVGLGIMTADCLPVVVIDRKNRAIGIAHAGWRGLQAGIIASLMEHMNKLYTTHSADIEIFFGPCAHVCCYEVQEDFVHAVNQGVMYDAIIRENRSYRFDLIDATQRYFEDLGISRLSMRRDYTTCTIHNDLFFSHRREPYAAGRQMTVVALRDC